MRGIWVLLWLITPWVGFCETPVVDMQTVGLQASEQVECQKFIESLPQDYIHGWLSVPEMGTDFVYHIFYYGKIVDGQPPTIFFNGGPRSNSHNSYLAFQQTGWLESVPMIFFDQPGTGWSTFQKQDSSFSTGYPSVRVAGDLDRLAHFGSRGIVQVAEGLRKHLLGEAGRWKIFGQSYGSIIVQRYLSLFPEHLMAAYAHGWANMEDPDEFLFNRIKSQVQILDEYLKQPGHQGDEGRLSAIAWLLEGRTFSRDSLSISGPALLGSLNLLLGRRVQWPELHRTIQALVDDQGHLVEAELNRIVKDFLFGFYGSEYAARGVIAKMEMTVATTPQRSSEKALRRLAAMNRFPRQHLNEAFMYAAMKDAVLDPLMEGFNTVDPVTNADVLKGLLKAPDLKFFFYSSALDTLVPAASFAEAVKAFGDRVIYRAFPNSGHDGFRTETDILLDLQDPDQRCKELLK